MVEVHYRTAPGRFTLREAIPGLKGSKYRLYQFNQMFVIYITGSGNYDAIRLIQAAEKFLEGLSIETGNIFRRAEDRPAQWVFTPKIMPESI